MPSHGGSRILMNDLPRPKVYHKGSNAKLHLQTVDVYLKQLKVSDEKLKFDILLNTLEEDCRYEIFSLFDFDENIGDPKWLVGIIQRLYGEKETPLKNMVRLLKVRQKTNQKLSDFVSEVRIEAFKIFGHDNKEEREKNMILAFMDGLRSRKTSFVLKEANLKTLDECFEFVKADETEIYEDEMLVTEECAINAVSQSELEKRVQELEVLVRQLKGKIDFLTRQGQQGCDRQLQHGRDIQFQKRERITFQKNGGACFNCGKMGHLARFCYAKGNRRFVNNILEEVDDDMSGCQSSDCPPSETNDDPEEGTVTAVDMTYGKNQHSKKYLNRIHGRTDKRIAAWNQYVQGQGGKPKFPVQKLSDHQYARTVLDNRREIKNKALVLCEVEGRTTKILFDSGSTQNVISDELFQNIGGSKRFRIIGTSRSLKCDNNSRLHCLGNVILNVHIGNTRCKKMFTIVQELSQKAIIGIRGMKALNIIIDARKNGIFCQNEFLPFVGKVSAPTEIQENI